MLSVFAIACDGGVVQPDAAAPARDAGAPDASARDAAITPDAGTPDLDATTPVPSDGGPDDASVLRDGGADASLPLGACTLERTVELASPRGTPSIVSDGARTFALWADIGDGVRGLDIDGVTPWPTDLPDGPLYAPVPFAQWRNGIWSSPDRVDSRITLPSFRSSRS